MAVTNNGTGAAITFNTTFFGEPRNISWSGVTRVAIDTSSLASTIARSFIPGDLFDPGELEVEYNTDVDKDPFDVIGSAAETVTLTFPIIATTGATWAASGFATAVDQTVPLEDVMVGNMTIKMTGDVTSTDDG